ncbi:MAG: 3-dehydroquinate synthase [Kiritimatiellae bacterium]|nr:3-dehydroquinate synthase [Kiritimatiellia bacterium]
MTSFSTTVIQRLDVPFEYPVVFGRDLFGSGNTALARVLRRAGKGPHRLCVCVDEGLLRSQPELLKRLQRYLGGHRALAVPACDPLIVPGGARAKRGWQVANRVMAAIGGAHLDRHSLVVAIGGGSVLDAVGLAAALVHRGIRLIRFPTTVLAQCDAGVGIKNGIDANGMKNFAGVFTPPFAVLNDFDLLASLPPRHVSGGLAEAFKVALIKDAGLYRELRRQAPNLRARNPEAIARIILRTARIHLAHIRDGGDPFELGSARPLDFGHWSGHKLELLTRHRLGHGEAVSIGIALDVCYAVSQRLLTAAQRDDILAAMASVGLPLWNDAVLAKTKAGRFALLDGLEEFREHLGGRLTMTLPRGIGHCTEVHRIRQQDMCAAMTFLRDRER